MDMVAQYPQEVRLSACHTLHHLHIRCLQAGRFDSLNLADSAGILMLHVALGSLVNAAVLLAPHKVRNDARTVLLVNGAAFVALLAALATTDAESGFMGRGLYFVMAGLSVALHTR